MSGGERGRNYRNVWFLGLRNVSKGLGVRWSFCFFCVWLVVLVRFLFVEWF